jgi:hypothetical protein
LGWDPTGPSISPELPVPTDIGWGAFTSHPTEVSDVGVAWSGDERNEWMATLLRAFGAAGSVGLFTFFLLLDQSRIKVDPVHAGVGLAIIVFTGYLAIKTVDNVLIRDRRIVEWRIVFDPPSRQITWADGSVNTVLFARKQGIHVRGETVRGLDRRGSEVGHGRGVMSKILRATRDQRTEVVAATNEDKEMHNLVLTQFERSPLPSDDDRHEAAEAFARYVAARMGMRVDDRSTEQAGGQESSL